MLPTPQRSLVTTVSRTGLETKKLYVYDFNSSHYSQSPCNPSPSPPVQPSQKLAFRMTSVLLQLDLMLFQEPSSQGNMLQPFTGVQLEGALKKND